MQYSVRGPLQVPNWVKTSEQEFANLKIDPHPTNFKFSLDRPIKYEKGRRMMEIKFEDFDKCDDKSFGLAGQL